tara:strand:+ start:285 stop:488 length:204 start_codon:yes stop_codon:yes gene_type:complete
MKIKILDREARVGDLVASQLDLGAVGLLMEFVDVLRGNHPMIYWISGYRKGTLDWIHRKNVVPVEII